MVGYVNMVWVDTRPVLAKQSIRILTSSTTTRAEPVPLCICPLAKPVPVCIYPVVIQGHHRRRNVTSAEKLSRYWSRVHSWDMNVPFMNLYCRTGILIRKVTICQVSILRDTHSG